MSNRRWRRCCECVRVCLRLDAEGHCKDVLCLNRRTLNGPELSFYEDMEVVVYSKYV